MIVRTQSEIIYKYTSIHSHKNNLGKFLPVPRGVLIREITTLQHFIRAMTNARYFIQGVECHLFDFSEIVDRISVQNHASDFYLREPFLWPYLKFYISCNLFQILI